MLHRSNDLGEAPARKATVNQLILMLDLEKNQEKTI